MRRRLYRSDTDRMVAGVCGGIADYLDIDAAWVRLVFVLLVFFSGAGIVAYIVLWVILPRESRIKATGREVMEEGVAEMGQRARELGEEVKEAVTTRRTPGAERGMGGRLVAGGILILLGAIFLLENFRFMSWLSFRMLWPLILVALGIFLLLRRRG